MALHGRVTLNRAGLWYGTGVGGFWGWLSGGGIGAVFGIVVWYMEPRAGALPFLAGIGQGMVWGAISGAVTGAVGGAVASCRLGLVAGIVAGLVAALVSASNSASPSWYGALWVAALVGIPAAVGGYSGARIGVYLADEHKATNFGLDTKDSNS
jgi:hypothetical protein